MTITIQLNNVYQQALTNQMLVFAPLNWCGKNVSELSSWLYYTLINSNVMISICKIKPIRIESNRNRWQDYNNANHKDNVKWSQKKLNKIVNLNVCTSIVISIT